MRAFSNPDAGSMFRTTDIKIREHDPRSYEINSSPRDFAGYNTAQIMKPDPAGVEEARFRNARALAAFFCLSCAHLGRAHGASANSDCGEELDGGQALLPSRRAPGNKFAASCRGRYVSPSPAWALLAVIPAEISTSFKAVTRFCSVSTGGASGSSNLRITRPSWTYSS